MAFPRAKNSKSAVLSNSNSVKLDSMSMSNATTSTSETAARLHISSRNPWDRDNQVIKNSRDALILAEQLNIKTLQNETDCAKAIADLPSSKLITLQKEITEKKKTAVKLKQDIATYHLYDKCADLLNLDTIEKRINMLKQMCNDLDSVLRNKEKLITRLQTPFVGDFIKVEANYHKYFREVLLDLLPSIINIGPYLDNITWMVQRDLSAGITEPLIVEVQSLVASLQTSYQMLYQMKTGVEEVKRKQEEEGSDDKDTEHSIQLQR